MTEIASSPDAPPSEINSTSLALSLAALQEAAEASKRSWDALIKEATTLHGAPNWKELQANYAATMRAAGRALAEDLVAVFRPDAAEWITASAHAAVARTPRSIEPLQVDRSAPPRVGQNHFASGFEAMFREVELAQESVLSAINQKGDVIAAQERFRAVKETAVCTLTDAALLQRQQVPLAQVEDILSQVFARVHEAWQAEREPGGKPL